MILHMWLCLSSLEEIIMFGIICRVAHKYIFYCKRALFCSSFPIHVQSVTLSTKTKLYNWSVGIEDKSFAGMCSLYATHTEQKQKQSKGKKKGKKMIAFRLDSLVSGVLFQFEMHI